MTETIIIEEVIDVCDQWDCLNNGVCTGSRGNSECVCQTGFAGEYCESILLYLFNILLLPHCM